MLKIICPGGSTRYQIPASFADEFARGFLGIHSAEHF
jgi:hypothetical protein